MVASVLPLHTMWVLPLFSQQIFLMKEVDKRDGKMIVAHYQPLYMGSFGCYAQDSCVRKHYVHRYAHDAYHLFV